MFELQLGFSKLFMVLSLIALPLAIGYSQNPVKGLANQSGYMLKQFSLGNMGGDSVVCINKKLSALRMIF